MASAADVRASALDGAGETRGAEKLYYCLMDSRHVLRLGLKDSEGGVQERTLSQFALHAPALILAAEAWRRRQLQGREGGMAARGGRHARAAVS